MNIVTKTYPNREKKIDAYLIIVNKLKGSLKRGKNTIIMTNSFYSGDIYFLLMNGHIW
jgi:hypothetical protein